MAVRTNASAWLAAGTLYNLSFQAKFSCEESDNPLSTTGNLAAAINAATLALMDAGVPMKASWMDSEITPVWPVSILIYLHAQFFTGFCVRMLCQCC